MTANPSKPHVLVTGANGFNGRVLCAEMHKRNWALRAAVRTPSTQFSEVAVGNIGRETQWAAALSNIDVVIHLAARVHLLKDRAHDPLAEFREVNLEGTKQL